MGFLCSVSWTTMTPTGLTWYWVSGIVRQRAYCFIVNLWLLLWLTEKTTSKKRMTEIIFLFTVSYHKFHIYPQTPHQNSHFCLFFKFLFNLLSFISISFTHSSNILPFFPFSPSLSLSRPWHPPQGLSRWVCWQSSVSDSPTACPLA